MKKVFTSILALLVFSISTQAQFYHKKIKGNGHLTTKTRTVGDYNKIGVAGSFNVELIKGTEGEITIQAEENLMDYIITDVKDGQLKIKTKKGYQIKSTKKIKITIPFSDVEAISLAGSGNIYTTQTIKAKELQLAVAGSGGMNLNISTGQVNTSISGSGNMKLQGDSNQFSCKIAGSGNLNGYNLKANIANAKVAGSGNIKIHAMNEIHAKIAGSGNIYYTGNPEIVKSNSAGSGSIKKKH